MDYSKLFNCNKKNNDDDDDIKSGKNITQTSLDTNKLGEHNEKTTLNNEISTKMRNQSTRQGGNRKGKSS